MKQLEVTIMGQSYLLGCPEGAEPDLMAAVRSVDREMCAIRDAGKVRARERIAVLAALNLAAVHRGDGSAESVPPAAAEPAAPTASAEPEVDLQPLLARLDRALQADGQLL